MQRAFVLMMILGLFFGGLVSGSFAQNECNVTKVGSLAVSPSEITFYVSAEDAQNPTPVTVQVNGIVYPQDNGDNETTWAETTQFCWMASSSKDWITFNGTTQKLIKGVGYGGSFQVEIDRSKLPVSQDVYLSGGSMVYEGNVTITSNLYKEEILGGDAALEERNIPVRVYVNSLRTVEEETLSTSMELQLPLNIPVSNNVQGALYILVEHPRLLPNQVYAYRYDSQNGPRYDLFSQNGHLVPGAGDLYYAADIQNVPVTLPYSLGQVYPPIPYQSFQMPSPDVNATSSNIKGYIPVSIGEGLSLHGLEGDIIVQAIVGDPGDIQNWRLWKELLYNVVHVTPITGTWVVTDEVNGKSYSYTENGVSYPMVLYEENGALSGVWEMPDGDTPLTVQYLDRPEGGYEIYFQEISQVFGLVDYLYRIESIENDGYIEGTWQYKMPGCQDWSIPQRFTAIRQEVVVPLDREHNSYIVDGKVNGYPVGFIVDTGANTVFLSSADAEYMGVDLSDPAQCTPGTAVGVGGEVSATFCYVDIEIEDRLFKQDVLAAFSDTWTGPGLLGMTFLDTFHVAISSSDGTMIIAP